MKKLDVFLLFIIFLTAISLRLYHLTSPIADWHSWRQADTAAVARNFFKFGFDPLHPRYDDLSNIQSGKDNPQGWRMVEFPLYQLFGAGLKAFVPSLSIEVSLRLVSIVASAGTALLLALLVSNFVDKTTGLLAGFFYAVLPYSVYYGRTILPDGFMVFLSVLSLYLISKSLEAKGRRDWFFVIIGAVAGALALLAKPVAIFLLVPVPYLLYRKFSFSRYLVIGLLVYWVIGLLPLWWWRGWIAKFPEGIPVYTWLFNEGNIRFKGAWFHWLFARRLGELILGYWGLIPLGIGLTVTPAKKEGWFFRIWLLGSLLYLVVLARGNVQHDYYQQLLVPIVVIYLAKGMRFLFSRHEGISRFAGMSVGIVSVIFMLAFSWFTVRTYYWINRPEIVEAGKMADQLLPKNAKVIASYNGDTTFLYQINRQGWPLGFDIDKKIKMGATAYVTVSPTDNDGETRALASRFTVLVRNDKFAIIDLTKPR